jgi:6-phosphogluconolactonase
MFSRRTFLSLVAGSMAAPGLASAQPAPQKVALYANVGADLAHYDVDVAGGELIKRAAVTLPAAVQYAWPHVSRRYLYVATSSSAPGYGTAGTEHHVTAFRIDPESGALTRHGEPIRLRHARSTSAPTFPPKIFWWRSTIRARCASIA